MQGEGERESGKQRDDEVELRYEIVVLCYHILLFIFCYFYSMLRHTFSKRALCGFVNSLIQCCCVCFFRSPSHCSCPQNEWVSLWIVLFLLNCYNNMLSFLLCRKSECVCVCCSFACDRFRLCLFIYTNIHTIIWTMLWIFKVCLWKLAIASRQRQHSRVIDVFIWTLNMIHM